MANGGGTDGRTDGRMEIPPCVLQDIGPLRPLPKKDGKRERERGREREKNRARERESERVRE